MQTGHRAHSLQSNSCTFWSVLVAAVRLQSLYTFLSACTAFFSNCHYSSEGNGRVFADKLVFSMQTANSCDELLVTKEITRIVAADWGFTEKILFKIFFYILSVIIEITNFVLQPTWISECVLFDDDVFSNIFSPFNVTVINMKNETQTVVNYHKPVF